MDISWKRLSDDRRRIRIITSKKTYLEKIEALRKFQSLHL